MPFPFLRGWNILGNLQPIYLLILTSISILIIPGTTAREEMMKSKLPNSVLRRIWALSDIDQDGMLDRDEFAVCMFLIDHKLAGNDIPDELPERMIPPSKKMLFRSQHFSSNRGGRGENSSVGGGPMSSYSQGNTHGDSYRGGESYRRGESYRGGESYHGGDSHHGGDNYRGGDSYRGEDSYREGENYRGIQKDGYGGSSSRGYAMSRGRPMEDPGDDQDLSSFVDTGN